MRRDLIAIILATVAFTLWGYVWYATIFDDVWQSLIGRSEAELIDLAKARGLAQNIYTVLISLLQVIAIFIGLKWTKASTFLQYVGLSVLLSSLVVLPSIGNTTLFVGTPFELLLLDYGHFLLGYAGITLVFFIVRPPNHKKNKTENL